MKVTFIHHSSFAVETEDKLLIFDYFAGDRVTGYHFEGQLPNLDCGKEVYMFVSHKHQDHFDMDILKLAADHPNIHYIFSRDTKMSGSFLARHGIPAAMRKEILFVAPDNTYELDGMTITTLRSTDAGVAFLVEVEGQHIYHAGDLHNWRMEHVGELINGNMERNYQHQVDKLSDTHIHVAFVVIDPRMESYKYRGIEYFMKQVNADFVFPMHLWQQFDLITSYKKMCDNSMYAMRIMDLTHENQEFELSMNLSS